MRQYRLAILECDTPVEPVLEKLGTYGQIFDGFAHRGLEAYTGDGGPGDIDLHVTTSNMVDMGSLPRADEVDCVMLTGSKHNAFEDHEWILRLVGYVRELYQKTQVALVGICFGHQIIARALGSKVQRNAGVWEVSVDQIDLTPAGQELFGGEKLALHQMHQDIVATLPDEAANLGHSPACDIQGMYIPKRVLSLQAHPEFSGFIMNKILNTRHDQNVFSDELFQSGTSRAEKQHDGLLVCKVIWRFLLNDL